MKKILAIILACVIVLGLFACAPADNSDSKDDHTRYILGSSALVELGDGLWYDSTTRIVYWWNGCISWADFSTTPSPYYAPNGLPYRYDPLTNTFEEIE